MRWALFWTLIAALILVPFFLFEDYFNGLAARLAAGEASSWLTASAIGAMLASDVLLPIPSSIVSTLAGAMLGLWLGTAVVWVGMTAGCIFGYVLGAKASHRARRMVGPDGIDRAAGIMGRYGVWALVMSRPVPVLAEASVVFAGIVQVPFRPFLLATSAANIGVALSYSAVGAFSMQMESFLLTFAGAMAVPLVGWLVARFLLGDRQAMSFESAPKAEADVGGEPPLRR